MNARVCSMTAEPEEEALRQAALVLEKWSKAFSASDVDAIVQLYSDDAIFVGTGSKTVVKSRDGIRKYFEEALLNNRPRGASLASCETMILSDHAVVMSGLDAVSGVRDGVSFSNGGRITFVVAKRGAEWKIVHFHRSAMPK